MPSVALVSMPFHSVEMPSIGLGILKATLSRAGLPCKIYDFNLDLLPELGGSAEEALETYRFFLDYLYWADGGEWLFSPPDLEADERYLALLDESGPPPERLALLRRLRSRVEGLVAAWAKELAAGRHDVVGFSCSLGRTRANVRLAEAVRRLSPGTRVLVGGFEASGDMGRALLEAFAVFDVACHGEADDLIVPIVRALREEPGTSFDAMNGVSYRTSEGVVSRFEGAVPADMDKTALPDYGDYFGRVEALRSSWDSSLELPRRLPVETARGCWWGDRRHCCFCSVNGDRMAFRAKSADRVLEDLDALRTRYGPRGFLVVDNVLDDNYFRTLLPRIAALGRGYLFQWEIRPNLGREEVATLARAGVDMVQPGIESLSTPPLRLMNKGTTAIENVQELKWLGAYAVRCVWNFLYSLPGEQLEWYQEVAKVLPRLKHLAPPRGPYRINVQRFSPTFSSAREMGVRVLGPSPFVRLAFHGLSEELVDRLAYTFQYEIEGRAKELDARIAGILQPLLEEWRRSFEERGCTLSIVEGADEALLVEGPLLRPDRILRVQGLLFRFLKGCESIQTERHLLERLAACEDKEAGGEPGLGPRSFRRVLEDLLFTGAPIEDAPEVTLTDVVDVADARGWVYRESGRILSLPVSQTRAVQTSRYRIQEALRRYE